MKTPKKIVHKNGTVVWRVRFKPTPGANSASETFPTFEEAQQFIALIDQVGGQNARAARTPMTASARTLNAAFEDYLIVAASHGAERIAKDYRTIYNNRIAPYFGSWPTDAIKRENVERWIMELRTTETLASARARKRSKEEGKSLPPARFLAPKTIANAHGLLSSILRNEVRAERLTVNRAEGIPLPRITRRKEPVFLKPGEFARILDELPTRWQPLVALLAATGMRWGEVTALYPDDFDYESAPVIVRVSKAWKRGVSGWYIGEPKTAAGVRDITLPPQISELLLPLVEATPHELLVFRNSEGGHLRGDWFRPIWKKAVKAAGIRRMPRLHDLRHTHASWLISQGVPLTVIQRRLGHSSIKQTSDIYGHLAPEAGAIAAAAVQVALSQALPEIEG